jgi:nucleoid-associated protein EbfC
MFDKLKNLGQMADLMRKAGEVQHKFKTMQESLAAKTVTADAGAGAVTAIVNGKLELVAIRIDKTKIDPADTELLEDLTVAAVAAAQGKASGMLKEEMAKAATEMGLPPGMLPGGLG